MEAAGEVPLEAAERSLVGLAFGFLALEVGLGGRVVAGASDRDDVERVVELAIAAAVEPVPVALSRGARDRCAARLSGEAGIGCEPLDAGGAADKQRCGQGAAAGLPKQLWAVHLD